MALALFDQPALLVYPFDNCLGSTQLPDGYAEHLPGCGLSDLDGYGLRLLLRGRHRHGFVLLPGRRQHLHDAAALEAAWGVHRKRHCLLRFHVPLRCLGPQCSLRLHRLLLILSSHLLHRCLLQPGWFREELGRSGGYPGQAQGFEESEDLGHGGGHSTSSSVLGRGSGATEL